MIIREYAESDLDELEAKLSLGEREYHRGTYELQVEGKVTGLVAEADGELVAHVCVRWLPPRHEAVREEYGDLTEVLMLATKPSRRRKGYARALVAAADQLIQSRGYDSSYLGVDPLNQAAVALYKSEGYEESSLGTLTNRYPAIVDGQQTEVVEEMIALVKTFT